LKILYGSVNVNSRDSSEMNMGNSTGYIRINSDNWDDAGKLYKVLEYYRPRPDTSSAVNLTLITPSGETIKKVVPFHTIEWIEDGDW
jgi:hypothetical protein